MAFSIDIRTQGQRVHPVLRPGHLSSDATHGDVFLRQHIQLQTLCHLAVDQVAIAAAVVEDQDFLVLDPQRLHGVEG